MFVRRVIFSFFFFANGALSFFLALSGSRHFSGMQQSAWYTWSVHNPITGRVSSSARSRPWGSPAPFSLSHPILPSSRATSCTSLPALAQRHCRRMRPPKLIYYPSALRRCVWRRRRRRRRHRGRNQICFLDGGNGGPGG